MLSVVSEFDISIVVIPVLAFLFCIFLFGHSGDQIKNDLADSKWLIRRQLYGAGMVVSATVAILYTTFLFTASPSVWRPVGIVTVVIGFLYLAASCLSDHQAAEVKRDCKDYRSKVWFFGLCQRIRAIVGLLFMGTGIAIFCIVASAR